MKYNIDNITQKVYNEKHKGETITIIKQRHATLKKAEKGNKCNNIQKHNTKPNLAIKCGKTKCLQVMRGTISKVSTRQAQATFSW